LAGSIRAVLPAALLFTREDLFSGSGGIAAAIAIGAFLGQLGAVMASRSDEDRRLHTAIGGFIGFVVMIGLILFSVRAG
jgi:hypothetical protein